MRVRELNRPGSDEAPRWLAAIAYQPYANREPCRVLTPNREEAFVFSERVAAELAAVFVGGEVHDEHIWTTVGVRGEDGDA